MSEAIRATPAWALALLRDARVGRLATADAAGRPLVVPVCYAADSARIYSAVDAKPKATRNLRRLRNIADNPQVSLVVDVWDEDWSRLAWVRMQGDASVVAEEAEYAAAVAALRAKYPQYKDARFAPASHPLIRVAIARVTAWQARP